MHHYENPYRYAKLAPDCIRLLILLPGPADAPIGCLVHSVNLFDFDDIAGRGSTHGVLSYEALSYVWSDPEDKVEIGCHGAGLLITRSLGYVLRRFRYVDKERVLWADGVCINQADVVERGQQVQLMGLIYWKAQRCLIWLGDDDEVEDSWKATHAADLTRRLSKLYQDGEASSSVTRSRDMRENLDSNTANASRWEALRRLLERKWFSRTWVIQELGLANAATFFCGSTSFDARQLRDTLSWVRWQTDSAPRLHGLNQQSIDLAYSYVDSTRGSHRIELGHDPTSAESFFDLLELARGLQCTDPRDAVYAFLGHPSAFKAGLHDVAPYKWYPRNFYDNFPTLIKPDYHETTSLADVYLRLSLVALRDPELGLNLLYHVSHDDDSVEEDFPSWVPRLNSNVACPLSQTARSRFHASGHLTPGLLVVDPAGLRLHLRATFLGKIVFSHELDPAHNFAIGSTGKQLPGQTVSTDGPNPIDYLRSSLDTLRTSFTNPQFSDRTSLAYTLTAGSMRHVDSVDQDVRQHLKNFDAYCRAALIANDGDVASHISDEDDDGADDYLRAIQSTAPNRGFFATQEGRLGLGPRITMEEDEVWLFMGASMPFVLRGDGEKSFKVIGLTYLHGVMKGEAVAGLNEGDFEDIVLS
jgi:hypothetical protein